MKSPYRRFVVKGNVSYHLENNEHPWESEPDRHLIFHDKKLIIIQVIKIIFKYRSYHTVQVKRNKLKKKSKKKKGITIGST